MKKIRLLLCAMLICALSLAMMTACEARLDSPGEIILDAATLTISWDKVPEAVGYSVKIGDTEKVTKANSYSLVDLEPGVYTIQVKALGDGVTARDSVTVTRKVERKYETGLSYRLINNTEYQLIGVGSASGDVVMESYYREKPVTSIAPSALANNTKLTSFTINEFVTTIPEKAFYNCAALTTVVIPDNITKIEKSAFQSCKELREVIIPNSITEIGNYAFSYCRLLENVQIGESVVKIGNYAFSDCTGLKEIHIPDSVKEIGDYAFSDCRDATSLSIGKNVETIGEFAFYSLSVDSITLPNALKILGNSAFEKCSHINSITVPNNVTVIGDRAFADCTALASIEVGNNLERIGADAFLSTPYVENYPHDVVFIGDWIITCKNPDIGEGKNINNYFFAGDPIGIADYAFYKCSKFTGADIPTVKYIGKYAFSQCKNMMNVSLGTSCTIINEGAFADCDNLKNAKISKSSVSFIDAFAFVNCKLLKSIELPATIEMIGAQAFLNTGISPVYGVIYAGNWAVGCENTEISNITIREGTVGIAMYSFVSCSLIGSVKFPNTLKVIGKGAFAACSTVSIEEFPSSLERIEDYAFYGCNAGHFGGDDYHIALPNSLTYIGRSAFYGALVMGLEIPSSCKYIGDYAFWGAMYLGDEVNFNTVLPSGEIKKETKRFYLTLNEGIEYIGSRAFFKCGIIDLVIPDSVTEMGIRAFYGCNKMKTLTIGSGLTKIPNFAFYGCAKLEEVHLSNGTLIIGEQAFQNCKALTTIDLGKTLTTIEKAAFLGCESLADLALPASLAVIGDHTFRGMWSDGSIALPASVVDVGSHAFYANVTLTIYAEGDPTCSEYWTLWNSSWRPVIYSCTLSPDKSYVVSVVKQENNVTNTYATGGISAPERSGYTFLGWATSEGGNVVYNAADIASVANGTTLYAVWQEQLAQ